MMRLLRLGPVLLALACGLTELGEAIACADDFTDKLIYSGPPRKQDEVFLLSTRGLDEPAGDAPVELHLQRFSEQAKREPLSVEAFCRDSAPDVPTLVYVHGYDFDEEKALRLGWAMYHALCGELPSRQSVRYVIWSWPSTAKRFRPARDVVDKSHRADDEGYWLAALVAQLPDDTRVGLIGSALGCRAVEGALHLLGGGEIDGRQIALPDRRQGPPIRTAFLSAAVHDDWLYPGEFHDKALPRAERMLLLNNSQDPTLRRYSQAWRSRPEALGLRGPASLEKFAELASRIRQLDVHEQVGPHHGVEHYLRSPELVQKMRQELLPPE